MLPITPSDANHIARLPKYKGQEYLARKLQLAPIDEDEDLRAALLVDYYYDVLQFSVNRGIRWKEVVTCLNFASQFLHSSVGLNFPGAVKTLHQFASEYVSAGSISLRNAKLLVEYMTGTFLAHFKLYKYVLTHTRDEQSGSERLIVEVPPVTMKLSDADTLQVFEYASKMHDIDEQESERKAKLAGLRRNLDEKVDEVEKDIKIQFLEGDLESLSLGDAQKLIEEITARKLALLEEDVQTEISELQDSTDIALARQAQPVPAAWQKSHIFLSKQTEKPAPELKASSAESVNQSARKKK